MQDICYINLRIALKGIVYVIKTIYFNPQRKVRFSCGIQQTHQYYIGQIEPHLISQPPVSY